MTGIFFRVCVTPGTMSFFRIDRGETPSAQVVHFDGYCLKVPRIHAYGIAAKMVNDQTFRYWPLVVFVSKPMGHPSAGCTPEVSVSSSVALKARAPHPPPTRLRSPLRGDVNIPEKTRQFISHSFFSRSDGFGADGARERAFWFILYA